VHSAGEKQRIRVQFDPFAARLVAERKWHESQRIREKADGSIVLEIELGGLQEIERWILSWGKHARVLAPKELVTRIREEASEILKRYDT
jgi:proteasome accessory factor B